MVSLSWLITVVAYLLGSVWAETMTLFGEEYHVQDDMLLLKNSETAFIGSERNFVEGTKYPIIDGRPTAYYAFDPDRVEIRNVTRRALDILESLTCFKFIEVSPTDTRSKLYYFKGGGCFSGVGYSSSVKRPISIGGGCDNVEIISHETMHSLGFHHTQCRPDRDEYVKVLFQNIDRSKASNYNKYASTKTYGTVYDYSSIMHYLSYFFRNSTGPTFITLDPSHARYISSGKEMRYSEAFVLNTYYKCFDLMGKSCSGVTCLNGGFLLDSCKCLCPDNFTGSACETFAGAWFKPNENDRITNQPAVFVTKGYPFDNPKEDALLWFKLPKCYYPRAKFFEKNIFSANYDTFEVRLDEASGYINSFNVAEDAILNGVGLEAVVRHNNNHVKPGRGGLAAVDFIPDGSCKENYAEFSKIVCTRQLSPNGDWVYQTPKYPDSTNAGMACVLLNQIDTNQLNSHQVTFAYDLRAGERFELEHGHGETIKLKGATKASITFVSSYPVKLMYKANSDNPGSFRYDSKLIKKVPNICANITNIISELQVSQPFTSSYPSTLYPNGVICNMVFKAVADKKLKISFDIPSLSSSESFVVYNDYRNPKGQLYVINKQAEPITISSSEMLVAYKYLGSPKFSSWKITVTPV